MARIASQSKGGYYPTPVEELHLLCKYLQGVLENEESIINLLDPCCGEGEALHMIAQALGDSRCIQTYGVELEEGRVNKAASYLKHVLHDGYENMRTEAKFSLLWLNPPYDERFGERVELTFLKALTGRNNMLERDGLLLFCVPQHVLKPAAGVISGRFRDVKVFRFTDANYLVFKQVILIARYGKSQDSKAIYKWLRGLGDQGPEAIPTLQEIDEVMKVFSSTGPIQYFRAGRLKLNELQMDFSNSPLLTEVGNKISPKSTRASMKNPMLPLKPTHTGIAIASGAVGGNMGTHIISGITKATTDVEEVRDEDGNCTGEMITKSFQSIVRVFSPSGIYDLE
ncbi:DUF6094 domain-containing protein [Paenibacillus sp. IITD108]|uniref:DUF6094 domain-containing protein n=1 Tax=Paenibacillus sp. IITD108 TaxID=3116649 RepID=UPI002F42F6D7